MDLCLREEARQSPLRRATDEVWVSVVLVYHLVGGLPVGSNWNPSTTAAGDRDAVTKQIDRANNILAQSGVDANLVWSMGRVLYHDGPEMTLEEVYNKVTAGSPPFEFIAPDRDQSWSDVVSVWHTPPAGDPLCGKAPAPVPPNPDLFYAVSAVAAPGCRDVFLHELAHLFGARHDRFTNGATNRRRYNFGFVNVGAGVYTTMAYPDKCAAAAPPVPCRHIAYMSTPLVTPDGAVIGIAPPHDQAADNARWMNENAPIVAGFRTFP